MLVGSLVGFFGGRIGMEHLRPNPGRWHTQTLMEGSGSIRHISWSPTGTEVVAEVEHNGTFEILIIPLDHQKPRVLVKDDEKGAPLWPAYSPDGQAIAVTRMGDVSMSVEILPSVGGPAASMLENASRAVWLTADTLVVSRITEGTAGLWRWNPGAGSVEQLIGASPERQYWGMTPRPGGGGAFLFGGSDIRAGILVGRVEENSFREWLPGGSILQGISWHPRGRSLAASVGHHIRCISDSGCSDILNPLLSLDYPSFDPTGTRLAVVEQHNSYDIVAADPETGALDCVKCGESKVGWGSVGPDASIFYRRSIDGGPCLFRVDQERSVEEPLDAAGSRASCPVVSPDSKRLAFLSRNPETGGIDLKVLGLSGGEPVRLATGVEGSEFPSWSPDGRFVAYAAGSPLRIWIVSAAGGESRTIGPSGADYPMWSPDGRWIAFSIWTDSSDPDQGAWLVSPEGVSVKKISSYPTRTAWSIDGRNLYQLRRENMDLVVYKTTVGSSIWSKGVTLDLNGQAPEHFEFQPLTVNRVTGDLVLNRRITRSSLLVFEGLDPERW